MMRNLDEKEKLLADLEQKNLNALRENPGLKLLPIETIRLMALRRALIEYIEGEIHGSSNTNTKQKKSN